MIEQRQVGEEVGAQNGSRTLVNYSKHSKLMRCMLPKPCTKIDHV